MTNLQKKSLQHVSETLKTFDTYPIYSALIAAMTEEGIDNAVRSIITTKYEKAVNEQSKKVSDAKEWVNALIIDIP